MDKTEKGEKKANKTGRVLEDTIARTLDSKGYEAVHWKKFEASKYLEQPIYSTQYQCGTCIYGKIKRVDFVLYHPQKHKNCLIIECKWQQIRGSVDEKYPYLVINIQKRYPYKSIILLDGEGYSSKAGKWLKKQKGNNLIDVLNIAEFLKMCNNDKF